MAQTRQRKRNPAEIREAQLWQGPEFRVHWERTALARAVALAVIGYRVKVFSLISITGAAPIPVSVLPAAEQAPR